MAQLVISAATSVAGAGGANIGAALARTAATAAASYAASWADHLIFGPRRNSRTIGPRLEDLQVQASTEGAPVFRVFGRARVAGQVIWTTNYKETIVEETQSSGGKGRPPAVETTVTEYLYSCSFAVGLCEGEIDRIGRVWADGKPINLIDYTTRLYKGDETQTPDSLIETVEGTGAAPAFRRVGVTRERSSPPTARPFR